MNQADLDKVLANERLQELQSFGAELNTLKWCGSDEGWELAIAAVRKHIDERSMEIMHKYLPGLVDSVLLSQATINKIGAA